MNTTNAITLIEPYDKTLSLILDVAQHEIMKLHESATYIRKNQSNPNS